MQVESIGVCMKKKVVHLFIHTHANCVAQTFEWLEKVQLELL